MQEKLVEKLTEELFEKLSNLFFDQPWLKVRGKALRHLVGIADSFAQQELIFDLLQRFLYIDGGSLTFHLKQLESFVLNDWRLLPDQTVFAPLHNDHNADSAQFILHALKASCSESEYWHEGKFKVSAPKAIHSMPTPSNIVLVDEFVGSGHQAGGVINWVKETAKAHKKEINIYLATIASMEVSRPFLENDLCGHWSSCWLKKGISDHYSPAAASTLIDLMVTLERKMLPQKSSAIMHSLGYNKSETLYKCENSTTPDNVFPIFHWKWMSDGSARPTILPSRI